MSRNWHKINVGIGIISFIVDLRHNFTVRNMNNKPVFVQSSEVCNRT